mmetsp:Transcript_39649/g.97448  ORF Transcript_39649/g.97448 Transcript_39649/m.97448 type:complete len:232 (-) Transcript_39649:911-1606(-)
MKYSGHSLWIPVHRRKWKETAPGRATRSKEATESTSHAAKACPPGVSLPQHPRTPDPSMIICSGASPSPQASSMNLTHPNEAGRLPQRPRRAHERTARARAPPSAPLCVPTARCRRAANSRPHQARRGPLTRRCPRRRSPTASPRRCRPAPPPRLAPWRARPAPPPLSRPWPAPPWPGPGAWPRSRQGCGRHPLPSWPWPRARACAARCTPRRPWAARAGTSGTCSAPRAT